MHGSNSIEKSEVIQKSYIFTPVECRYKILHITSENIKYTLYFINISLYFTIFYIINSYTAFFIIVRRWIKFRLIDDPIIKLHTFKIVGWGLSFFACFLVFRGTAEDFLLLRIFSGAVQLPKDL